MEVLRVSDEAELGIRGRETASPSPTSWKFDHIGVVARKLSFARDNLQVLLGVRCWTQEFEDPVNDVFIQFGIDGSGICYESIAPRSSSSPVAAALKSGARILNHVAYLVPNLENAAQVLTAHGSVPVATANPAIAYRGALIQFFVTPLRLIVELIEAPEHKHDFSFIEGGHNQEL